MWQCRDRWPLHSPPPFSYRLWLHPTPGEVSSTPWPSHPSSMYLPTNLCPWSSLTAKVPTLMIFPLTRQINLRQRRPLRVISGLLSQELLRPLVTWVVAQKVVAGDRCQVEGVPFAPQTPLPAGQCTRGGQSRSPKVWVQATDSSQLGLKDSTRGSKYTCLPQSFLVLVLGQEGR